MNKYVPYALFLLIAILVVILQVNDFGPVNGAQQSVDDLLCSISSDDAVRTNIVLIAIDERAQSEYGQWPWNRDLVADLLAAAASGKPKTIVANIDLSENASQDSAGFTQVLAGQLGWMENIVLPFDVTLANYRSNKSDNPLHMFKNSMSVANPLGIMSESSSLLARKVFLPSEKLLEFDPYLGFDYVKLENDKNLRYQPMVVYYEGYYYPSLELMASASYFGVTPDKIEVTEGSHINIGTGRSIPINQYGELQLSPARTENFSKYSAAQVLEDGFDFSRLKDKLVLVGLDDFGSETFTTPLDDETSNLTVRASTIDNIINGNLVTQAVTNPWINIAILLGLAALFGYVLPQVSTLYRFVILMAGMFILANISYFLYSSFHMTVHTMYISLELLLFMLCAPILDIPAITGEKPSKFTKQKASDRVLLGSSDEIPVRELRDEEDTDKSGVPTGAISASDSTPVDHQTVDLDPLTASATCAISTSSDSGSAGASVEPDEDLVIKGNAEEIESPAVIVERPTPELPEIVLPSLPSEQQVPSNLKNLGRYLVTGVLGRGAMGQVYKGIDPAINRPVALKTIRLDFVNDPAEMEELKERLFREAQAAGKLSHPNIVTIYDVGSEGHLQYIAMEYLEGQTLEDMIKRKTKFNYRIIAQIIVQICSALTYAHERGIIHRDIKPANLMVLKDYSIKVMDYGIARLDTNSMTKTGIAMGTPHYISPEQLQGREVDSRADLFSLGVVMHELLLGERPFKGENLSSLIYSIMHTEPEKPSNTNPDIPLLFDQAVCKSLAKDPDQRYQKASEIASQLSDFVESFVTR